VSLVGLALALRLALQVTPPVGIAVRAPDSVNLREPVRVTVTVQAPAGAGARLFPPSFAPFRVLSRTDAADDQHLPSAAPGARTEHRFVLLPMRSGAFDIGPFEVRSRAGIARSRAIHLVVRDQSVGGAPSVPQRVARQTSPVAPDPVGGVPAVVARSRLNPAGGVGFHALVLPETLYVGQQATYQVGVFLDDAVRSRLRRNPEFVPPELRSVLAYELPAGRALYGGRQIGGRRYEVHVFQRALFPVAAGEISVAPAQLQYALPLSTSFFAREESFTLRSEDSRLVAVEPPDAGRPGDYGGAVGVLRIDAKLDTAAARVGDPLMLTLRVRGTGNVKLFPRPDVRVEWASVVDGGERVVIDSSALLLGGVKEFDFLLTPRLEGAQTLPPIPYPYFDPYARRYDVSLSAPLAVTIRSGTLVSADSARTEPSLPLRATLGAPVPTPLPDRFGYWLVALVAPLPALFGFVARRPRAAPAAPPASARLQRLARASIAAERAVATDEAHVHDAATLRRTFVSALATRVGVDAPLLTGRGRLARRLRRVGVSDRVALDTEAMLAELDAAAYAGTGIAARDAAARADALFRAVDREACGPRSRFSSALPFVALVLAVMLAARSGLAWQSSADPAVLFNEGVAAYQANSFHVASERFQAAARLLPRTPSAWANYGTAAWEAADTVGATVGWQRAARLDPLAADVRDRLELLPSTHVGWFGLVPPLPVGPTAVLALVLWSIACGLLALVAWGGRGSRRSLRAPLGLAVIALSALCMVSVLQRVNAARDLAVVRDASKLRDSPVLGAEPRGNVTSGEIVRTVERREAWSRVRTSDAREGWVESARLDALGE
jgi:hypothetical protein